MAAALVLPVLTGCDSTFQQNTRAEIAAARRLAAKSTVSVTQRGADVRVERVTLLTGDASTVVVADLRNRGTQALTDVPISVGVRRGTRKLLLNDAPDLDWWQTHLASIPAGGHTTWVFQSPPGDRAHVRDTPFVRVGDPDPKLGRRPTGSFPTIGARVRVDGSAAKVELTSASVPQLGLPVSVVLRRGDEPVAAGTHHRRTARARSPDHGRRSPHRPRGLRPSHRGHHPDDLRLIRGEQP
ncbi:MAG: hypothetical protein PGN13_08905 [Patulibacter minatonensis]